MASRSFAVVLALVLTVPVQAADRELPQANEMRQMMRELGGGGLEGEALATAIAEAEKHPLGSKDNPVRVNMPAGQRAYLDQLRCSAGETPSYFREGNVGVGPFGYIVDLYQVTCPGADAVQIYMDMYHDTGEPRPVPGFSIAN